MCVRPTLRARRIEIGKVTKEERIVAQLLKDEYNLTLAKILESEIKTPDFSLTQGGTKIAICELKSFFPDPVDEAHGYVFEGGIYTRETEDNGPNRVARKIDDAYKQLRNSSSPKVLIFYNKDSLLDVLDLEECYNGFLKYSTVDGKFSYNNVASKRIAFGSRIVAKKKEIDLYIWIDAIREPKVFFRVTSPTGESIYNRCFAGGSNELRGPSAKQEKRNENG